MRWRKIENVLLSPEEFMRRFHIRNHSILALPNADVEAHYAVLVASAHHGNIPVDVVFALNNL